jgi:hypothetical protein
MSNVLRGPSVGTFLVDAPAGADGVLSPVPLSAARWIALQCKEKQPRVISSGHCGLPTRGGVASDERATIGSEATKGVRVPPGAPAISSTYGSALGRSWSAAVSVHGAETADRSR